MKVETKIRRRMYDDHTGSSYEEARYGDPHKEKYRQTRNLTLYELITENFDTTNRLQILEVGCGTGMTLTYLASRPIPYDLVGLDFSGTMLSQAHEKLGALEKPYALTQGDSFNLPFSEGKFDVVYSTRFIHQFGHEDKKRIHREMMRVLKPGGLVINEYYSRHSRWSLYLRGFKKYPTKNQCPTYVELRDIVGRAYTKRPVRVIGQRAISNLFGDSGMRYVTSLASTPPLNMILEEYFVVSKKDVN